jgi:hypothetical protein
VTALVALDDTFYFHFGTSDPTTGAATNADSLPAVTVEEDGVAMGYAPTVTNIATGLYRVTVVNSTANGFEVLKRYAAYVVATVSAITGRDGMAEWQTVDADLIGGLSTFVDTGYATIIGYVDELESRLTLTRANLLDNLVNLDVVLSTRGTADPGDAMTLTGAYDPAKTAAQAGDAMALTGAERIAIRTEMDANSVDLNSIIASLTTVIGYVDDLEARLTLARANLLDNLVNLDAAVSSRGTADPGDAMALTPAAVDAILDEVVEGTYTFRQMLRIFFAVLALKSTGGGTATISFKDLADAKNRVSVTVDASNNRTVILTLDGT